MLVDGVATKACVLTTELASGRDIVTVEGLPEREREAFVYAFGAVGAVQCGFCIPGMVMAGAALIHRVPDPTEAEIKEAIRGNVCRCTGYKKIIEGIALAAAVLRGEAAIDPELERGERYGVGEPAFRVDVRPKVLGFGKYPDDIDETDLPGLAYAGAVRSRHPRARVLKIDAERARSMPGVLAVLTAADVPVNAVGHLLYDWDVMIAEGDVTHCVATRSRSWWPRTPPRSRGPSAPSRCPTRCSSPCARSRRRAARTRPCCTVPTWPSATGSRPRTTSARAATWSAATRPRRSRAPRTR